LPDSDQRPDIEASEELLADMPLPAGAKTFFLGGIFVLSMLTAAYVARDIVLPMIFAAMLNLLMQPALSALEGLRCPGCWDRFCSYVVFATIVGIGRAVSGPAEAWIAKLPEGIPRIQERLTFLTPRSIRFEKFWRRPIISVPRARSRAHPDPSTAERFCRAFLPAREASPAGCSPP
jgi:hypothetical protein